MSAELDEHEASDLEAGVRLFQQQIMSDYQRLSDGGPADLAERRRIAERVREPWTKGGPQMAQTVNLRVGALGVPIRIHRPVADPALPVLIYAHGGGWTIFSVDTHDRLMREYAARAGITVIGVDFSLAPEARFPSQIHELVSVVRWIRSSASNQWLAAEKLAIGGDSAGANLALATNLALRAGHERVLDAMLLNYGAFDPSATKSHDRYGSEEYMLTPQEMAEFWSNYLPEEASNDPLGRPLMADLHALPPTYFCIAECDILADENWEMAQRLLDSDVPVVAKGYAGATHSFLEAVSVSRLADEALDDAARWLSEVLRR